MKPLVIFDSFFGNTEKVAEAIGQALGARVLRLSDAKPEDLNDVDLLIIGSPTRAARPTPKMTEFLQNLPSDALRDRKVAAFDTRIAAKDIKSPGARFFLGLFISLAGYAAKPLAKSLEQKGGKPIADPDGFYVLDSKGPLKDGELNRAKKWAEGILAKAR